MTNLFNPEWDATVEADGAVLRAVRLARHAGARRLAANLYELEPGAAVSPLHFHHRNEELLFVLTGAPSLRHGVGDGEIRALAPGEIVAFVAGPAGTHQIINHSADNARVLICATDDEPEVAEQPETGHVAVIAGGELRLLQNAPAIAAP